MAEAEAVIGTGVGANGVSRPLFPAPPPPPPVSLSIALARAAVEFDLEILRSSPSDGKGLGVFRPTPGFMYGEWPRWAGESCGMYGFGTAIAQSGCGEADVEEEAVRSYGVPICLLC